MASSKSLPRSSGSCHRRRAQSEAKNIRTRHKSSETREGPSKLKDIPDYSYQSSATAEASSARTGVGTTNGYGTEASSTPLAPQNQTYYLYGISAQFWDYQCPSYGTIVNTYQRAWHCPYHGSVLHIINRNQHVAVATDEPHTLHEYMNGDPSQQYALYCQPGSDRLSIDKGCLCVQTCAGTGVDWLE